MTTHNLKKKQRKMLGQLATTAQDHLDEIGFNLRAHGHLAQVREKGFTIPSNKQSMSLDKPWGAQ